MPTIVVDAESYGNEWTAWPIHFHLVSCNVKVNGEHTASPLLLYSTRIKDSDIPIGRCQSTSNPFVPPYQATYESLSHSTCALVSHFGDLHLLTRIRVKTKRQPLSRNSSRQGAHCFPASLIPHHSHAFKFLLCRCGIRGKRGLCFPHHWPLWLHTTIRTVELGERVYRSWSLAFARWLLKPLIGGLRVDVGEASFSSSLPVLSPDVIRHTMTEQRQGDVSNGRARSKLLCEAYSYKTSMSRHFCGYPSVCSMPCPLSDPKINVQTLQHFRLTQSSTNCTTKSSMRAEQLFGWSSLWS